MKTFICYQSVVDEEVVGNRNKISISTLVRIVEAENKAEVIGKFALGTENKKHQTKLAINCALIEHIIDIK